MTDPNDKHSSPNCGACKYCKFCSFCKICSICTEDGYLAKATSYLGSAFKIATKVVFPSPVDINATYSSLSGMVEYLA